MALEIDVRPSDAPLIDCVWRGRSTGVGIRFRLGVMLQDVPIPNLVDRETVLPEASHRSFWWKGGTWERPTYENAEVAPSTDQRSLCCSF